MHHSAPEQAGMPQRLRARAPTLVASILIALLVVGFSVLVAFLGGFLNHCRGGYVHFGPNNMKPGTHVYNEWYWPQHILGRMLFALPTGLVVIVFGLHLRGSIVVTMMTWFSLYVGWGAYMNIGMEPTNYCSPDGTFDWLIGRQGYNWSTNERFVREYSGMSLRGLIWTLPQGYVLEQMGFGWEYSLTGSVMPLIYFIGANTNTTHVHGHPMKKLVDGSIAVSELVWGMWVWFVLIIACLSQAVRRSRIWIYRRNPTGKYKPFSTFEKIMYESLNRPVLRAFYDGLVIMLTILYCISVTYYSLVVQNDMRNKGQTFFGLFTAVLFLVFSLSWVWGVRYKTFQLKRYARILRGRTRTNNAIYNGSGESPNESDSPDEVLAKTTSLASHGELAHCEGLVSSVRTSQSTDSQRTNTAPLLSWPYSHPDRLSPTGEQRQQVLDMSEHLYPNGVSSRYAFIYVWEILEKWIWMDMFIYARRTIGVVSLITTIFSMMITITAMIIGTDSARFIQNLDPPCPS